MSGSEGENKNTKWEPADVTRLVALIGGLLLMVLGAAMMWKGISAEGEIDIKASVMSGHVKTGSAGLLIAFLSFGVIVFAISAFRRGNRSQEVVVSGAKRSKSAQLRTFLILLLLGTAISTVLAVMGYVGFGVLAFFLGTLTVPTVSTYVDFLAREKD